MQNSTSAISENSAIVLHISQLEAILHRILETTNEVNSKANTLFGNIPSSGEDITQADNKGMPLIQHMDTNTRCILNALGELDTALIRLNDL